jgi:hypothetical protein
MFRITAETCHAFTLAEVLILAAINLESARVTPNPRQSMRLSKPHVLGRK